MGLWLRSGKRQCAPKRMFCEEFASMRRNIAIAEASLLDSRRRAAYF